MLEALNRAIRIPELRRKLLWTMGLLLVFRVLASITVPGADPNQLQKLFAGNSVLGLLNLFSGGGLSNFSIVAEGLNPYINATIIMQLMTVVSLRLKEISKEGDQGRKKINRYTRALTVPLAAIQGYFLTQLFVSQQILTQQSTANTITIVLTLTAGTVAIMWLGELITEYGVSNGVSLIIFAGIIGRLPGAIFSTAQSHPAQLVIVGAVAILVTAGIIYVQQAQRKVPVQSAQRVLNPRTGMATQARRNFLPLKINTAGVIPIVFAIALMTLPTIFSNLFVQSGGTLERLAGWIRDNWQPNGPKIWADILYNGLYFILILGFTYFYTAIVFDPNDVADNLKKQSTFIPGIRPGQSTAEYLGRVMARITLAGALFLAMITVVLPLFTVGIISIFSAGGNTSASSLYLGGTAVLIVVGVALDTMKQLETQLMMRQYRGFIK